MIIKFIIMFHAPNNFRVRTGEMGSDDSYGNNGCFIIPLNFKKTLFACVIASDGMGWKHVSVHLETKHQIYQRTPNWDEMCLIKDYFWSPEDTVIQYHPPKSQYINNHKYTLHLWKKIDFEFPLPPSILIGIK